MLNLFKSRGISNINFSCFNTTDLLCIKECIVHSEGILIALSSCKIIAILDEDNEEYIFKTGGYNRKLKDFEEIYDKFKSNHKVVCRSSFNDLCIKLCLRAYIEESNIFFCNDKTELEKFYSKFDVIPDTENLSDDSILEVIYVPDDDFDEIQFENFLKKYKLSVKEYSKITVHKKTIYIKNGSLVAPINSLIEFIESQPGEVMEAECGPQRVHIIRFNKNKFSKLKLLK